MDKIAQRLKAYIDTHPFDPGDSDCEIVKLFWNNCTKPMLSPTKATPWRLAKASRN